MSYLLGSLNSSIIVVKLLKHEDIRKFGSGNAGLTNTLRCFGKGCAGLTLLGDLTKGIIAVSLSRLFCKLLEGGLSPENLTHYVGYIAGFFAIIGHVFPLYYGFRGGKGVLVGVSSFIAVDPVLSLVLITVFIVVVAKTKYVSLGSIVAASICAPATFIVHYFLFKNSLDYALLYCILSFIMSSTIIIMHRENIKRLKAGNENKLGAKKKSG